MDLNAVPGTSFGASGELTPYRFVEERPLELTGNNNEQLDLFAESLNQIQDDLCTLRSAEEDQNRAVLADHTEMLALLRQLVAGQAEILERVGKQNSLSSFRFGLSDEG